MQIKKQTSSRKYWIAGVIILLLLGGAAAFAFFSPLSPFSNKQDTAVRPENTVSYESATEEQKKAGEEAKKEALARQEAQEKLNQSPTPSDEVKTIDMTISSVSQNDGMLEIRTTIETRDTNGKCVLTLSKEGRSNITQEAGTQIQGSYSVCKGFDVPTASLIKGSWRAVVNYAGSSGKGEASQQVEVQ